MRISRRRFAVAAGVPTVLALTAGSLLLAQGAKASNTIAVEVNTAQHLGTVSNVANGLNAATFDGHLNDSAVIPALTGARVDALRYPGGSTADAYHWQTNTTVDGLGYANPNNGFDDFMGIAQKTGASPIITVNYGSGTAEEAAAWVKYANVTKHYGVKYWELGNEIPGDGTYGAHWEEEKKPLGATTYANNIADYITQMKAVDPGIKVGAVLTTYNSWPDGSIATQYGDTADWNTTVLKRDGSKLDFVIVHDYPSSNSESQLLNQYQHIASVISHTRAEINQYAGGNASNVQIMITETNASFESDSVPAALYAADSYMTYFQNGVANVDWWDLHNGPSNTSRLPDGLTDFGDGGVLSAGGCAGNVCEPAANTPFPAYYGLQAVGGFATPGAEMVGTTTSDSLVTSYAVKTATGMNLMLVNHSAQTSEPVSINYAGFNPAGVTSAQQFSEANRKLGPISGLDARSLTLPPYSITTLQLTPAGGKSASTASPTGATSSAPAAGTGSHTSAAGSRTSAAAAQSGAGSTTTTASGKSGTAPGSTTSTAAAHEDKAAASIGPLAFTGAGSVVTYGLLSVIAIVVGSVLLLRRRSVKKSAQSAHRQ